MTYVVINGKLAGQVGLPRSTVYSPLSTYRAGGQVQTYQSNRLGITTPGGANSVGKPMGASRYDRAAHRARVALRNAETSRSYGRAAGRIVGINPRVIASALARQIALRLLSEPPSAVFLDYDLPNSFPMDAPLSASYRPGITFVGGEYQWNGQIRYFTNLADLGTLGVSQICANVQSWSSDGSNTQFMGIYQDTGVGCGGGARQNRYVAYVPPNNQNKPPVGVKITRPSARGMPFGAPAYPRGATSRGLYNTPLQLQTARPVDAKPRTNVSFQWGPPGGGVSVKTDIPPIRPPRGVKERKVMMPAPVAAAINTITEALDILDILYQASGGKYPGMTPQRKLEWLFLEGGINGFDPVAFALGLGMNSLEDAAIGRASSAASDARHKFAEFGWNPNRPLEVSRLPAIL